MSEDSIPFRYRALATLGMLVAGAAFATLILAAEPATVYELHQERTKVIAEKTALEDKAKKLNDTYLASPEVKALNAKVDAMRAELAKSPVGAKYSADLQALQVAYKAVEARLAEIEKQIVVRSAPPKN